MLSKNTLEVGAEVEAMCTKCKGPSIHVIEVIKNDKITKVLCKSCLSTHKYKPVESEKDAPQDPSEKVDHNPKGKSSQESHQNKRRTTVVKIVNKSGC